MDKKIEKHLKDNHVMTKFFNTEIKSLKPRPVTAKPGQTKTSIQRKNLHSAPVAKTTGKSPAIKSGVNVKPKKADDANSVRLENPADGQTWKNILNDNRKVTNLGDLLKLNFNSAKRAEKPPTVADSVSSFPSSLTTMTSNHTKTTINHNGSQLELPFNPLRLLQFLFMELKTEVKEYLPKGDTKCSKILRDMASTIKQLSTVEDKDRPQSSSTNSKQMIGKMVKHQTTQTDHLITNSADDDNYPSIMKLQNESQRQPQHQLLHNHHHQQQQWNSNNCNSNNIIDLDKYYEIQMKLDDGCRHLNKTCSDMMKEKQIVSQELANCKDEIVHLRKEISFLQEKLRMAINDDEKLTAKQLDDKCKDLKSEIKTLQNLIESEQMSKHNEMIDNLKKKLVKSCEKINDLEDQCAQRKKEFVCQQLENAKLDILLKSRDSQIQDIGNELSNIHLTVMKEIEAIRNKFNEKNKTTRSKRKENLLASASTSDELSETTDDDKESTVANNKKLLPTSKMSHNDKNKQFNDDYSAGGDSRSDVDQKMRKFIDMKRTLERDEAKNSNFHGNGDGFSTDIGYMLAKKYAAELPTTKYNKLATETSPPIRDDSSQRKVISNSSKLYDFNELYRVVDNVTLPDDPLPFEYDDTDKFCFDNSSITIFTKRIPDKIAS